MVFLLIERTAGTYLPIEELSDIAFLLVQSGITRHDRLGLVGKHANLVDCATLYIDVFVILLTLLFLYTQFGILFNFCIFKLKFWPHLTNDSFKD